MRLSTHSAREPVASVDHSPIAHQSRAASRLPSAKKERFSGQVTHCLGCTRGPPACRWHSSWTPQTRIAKRRRLAVSPYIPRPGLTEKAASA
eukprot:scaffold3793_cov122-Isochrysis_galbana.AAC.2